jgi:hypothetical protein
VVRAAHKSGGEARLGLSATAAAAALYGAIILFGLGSASSSALNPNGDSRTPVVRLPHDSAVSGPALRLPQVSPGPGRQRSGKASPSTPGSVTAVPAPLAEQPEHPLPAPSEPKAAAAPAPAAASLSTQAVQPSEVAVTIPTPEVTLPTVTVPTVTLPTVTLPTVTLPTVTLPPVPDVPVLPPLP